MFLPNSSFLDLSSNFLPDLPELNKYCSSIGKNWRHSCVFYRQSFSLSALIWWLPCVWKMALFIHFRFLHCCTVPHLPNHLSLILSLCSWLYVPLSTTLLLSFSDLFSNMPGWFLFLILFQVFVDPLSLVSSAYLIRMLTISQSSVWTPVEPYSTLSCIFTKTFSFWAHFFQPVLHSLLKVISLGHVSLNLPLVTWNEMVPEMYQDQDTRSILLCLYPQDLLQD